MATNLLLPPLTPKSTGPRTRGKTQGPPTRKISPTYVSSDLHSPQQTKRITIPFLGVQPQESQVLGGKTWGENTTSYGGIGKMSFLGKKRAKDLFVSRGQKHFIGGLSKYENQMQPYMLTAFKYSGCRQNDQVLPPCFKVGLNPQDLTVFDGSPIIPYFSHNCKHEVFPRNDPHRLNKEGQPVLSERTRNSLHEMYEDLYEEPFYNKTFPDHFKDLSKCDNMFTDSKGKGLSTLQQNSDNSKAKVIGKYNINPILAKLCFLSSRKQETGKMAPLRLLLMNYLEHPAVFSEFRFEEMYRVLKDLQLFSSSDSAKHFGIDLEQYPFQRLIDILDSNATNTEKLLLVREALGLLPQSSCDAPAKLKSLNEDGDNDSKEITCEESSYIDKDDQNISMDHRTAKDIFNMTLPSRTADLKETLSNLQGEVCESVQDQSSSRERMPGTSPCWPPSKSYCMDLKTMQLKCHSHLSPSQCTGHCDSGIGEKKTQDLTDNEPDGCIMPGNPLGYNCPVELSLSNGNNYVTDYNYPGLMKMTTQHPDFETKSLMEYKQYLESFLPVSFDLRGEIHEKAPHKIMIPPFTEKKLNKANYVGYDKSGRETYLPPVSLTDCLQHTGNRIQDRLGLHFKTEAHKRFHAMYPDAVPDLRDNINYRKRYFFSGYHTSTFRG